MIKYLLGFFCCLFTSMLLAQTTYIHCGKLIDTQTGEIKKEQTIVVEGTKIIDVLSGYVMPRSATAKSIDLRSKVVMPGLIDMHVHIEQEFDAHTRLNGYILIYILDILFLIYFRIFKNI